METESSERIEIEFRAYHLVRRRRHQATWACANCQMRTAPRPPTLLHKRLLGRAPGVWILLDMYAGHRPMERLLVAWEGHGPLIAARAVASG
jgi:hypothetical protein